MTSDPRQIDAPLGKMTAAEMVAWIDAHPSLPTHVFMEPCGQAEGTDHCWYCGLGRVLHASTGGHDIAAELP